MSSIPHLRTAHGRTDLLVDDAPYIILGFQWSCDLSSDEAYVEKYLPAARTMGCNTAVIPLYWRDVEPTPGAYRFDALTQRIRACRANGLRMVILWFGAYKNAQLWYTPDWVYGDTTTYPRSIRSNGSAHNNAACPLGAQTLARDRAAFVKVMECVKEVDQNHHTVIMVQIENEAGLLTTDRCYCPTCSKRYADEGWTSAEEFTATCVARFIEALAVEAKRIHPLPLYANAWLDNVGFRRPGVDYPSGGPVPRVFSIYKKEAPHIDFLAPDTYDISYAQFHETCRAYAGAQPFLFVAEHSTYGEHHRAEKNILYALGEFGAIGFDPYCINNNESPVVRADGSIEPRMQRYLDTISIINDALPAIAQNRATPRLKTFVAEEAEHTTYFTVGDYAFMPSYRGEGRGFVVQLTDDEYLIGGINIQMRICSLKNGAGISPLHCEWGRYESGEWKRSHVATRESLLGMVPFAGPAVARVKLGLGDEWEGIRNTQ